MPKNEVSTEKQHNGEAAQCSMEAAQWKQHNGSSTMDTMRAAARCEPSKVRAQRSALFDGTAVLPLSTLPRVDLVCTRSRIQGSEDQTFESVAAPPFVVGS